VSGASPPVDGAFQAAGAAQLRGLVRLAPIEDDFAPIAELPIGDVQL
jgi:hypothetical protein